MIGRQPVAKRVDLPPRLLGDLDERTLDAVDQGDLQRGRLIGVGLAEAAGLKPVVLEKHVVARHASSRLPGKALLDIGGKPLILRVWETAIAAAPSRDWDR